MLLRLAIFALMATTALAGESHQSQKQRQNTNTPRHPLANCHKMGQKKCKGVCVDLLTNPKHCGKCKAVCPAGTTCKAGRCVKKNSPQKACMQDSACEAFVSCGTGTSATGGICGCVSDYVSGELSCQDLGGLCVACQFASDCKDGPGAVCVLVFGCCWSNWMLTCTGVLSEHVLWAAGVHLSGRLQNFVRCESGRRTSTSVWMYRDRCTDACVWLCLRRRY